MARKPASAAKGEKALYTVKSPLEHDGVMYENGDQVELTADQAQPLLGHTVEATKAEQAAG